jgi:polyferredoxin
MKPKHITLWRRIVQAFCFAALLYGVFLWGKPIATPLPKLESGTPRTSLYARGRALWVSGSDTVFELYPPTLACRFAARGGIFKSCILHMFSENLTWLSNLGAVIPHVFLFLLLSFLFARFWCGWVCPLGAITDSLNGVRKALRIPGWHVAPWTDTFFRGLRHVLLWASLGISLLIALPWFGLRGVNDSLFLVYCQVCPARLIYPVLGGAAPCLYDLTNAVTIFLTTLSTGFLLFFLAGFFVPRLWCRVCAIGALVSYFNRGGAAWIRKDAAKCTFCGACRRCCPTDIEMVYRERTRPDVTDSACLFCLRCVEECPEKQCLEAKLLGRTVAKS